MRNKTSMGELEMRDQASIAFAHVLPKTSLVCDRAGWLVDQCRNKTVLHIGCVDSGMTKERLQKGALLHERLMAVSADVIGVDIDANGIAVMESMGFSQLLAADVSESAAYISDYITTTMGRCDLVVCGEVLEHVPNYGHFLAGVREVAATFGADVILTVPNAFSLRAALGIVAGVEIVHPDHKCYFSWKTLSVLLDQQGFHVEQTLFYSNESASWSGAKGFTKKVLNRTILRWRPYLSEGVIAVARAK